LTTEAEENSIWAFPLNYVFDVLRGDGKVVDLVCQDMGCLDGSDVGIDENGGNASFFEGL
jgi:hypothetical protein